MAHIHKKIKKGRPYYYVRETARVNGKPKVINQVYLGSPERIMKMAAGELSGQVKIQVQEFGALWLANLVDREVGIADIIDSVVPGSKREKGPSVGEYFLYGVLNRMVDSRSKRALPEWFASTAIQHIRPVDTSALSSQRFWKKWDRVDADQLQEIARRFFQRIAELEPDTSDCFLFDTTNYYTFMAGNTPSDLARRGKNKEGRNWLRQVGVALLVSRKNRLPLYYREYEGNRHDSKLFLRVMDELFSVLDTVSGQRGELTLVVDKGMNSEENFALIDANPRIHFITTYSTYHAEDLIHVDRDEFEPVDTDKNRILREQGRGDDQLVAWRTSGEHWGRTRTVVVTYNPRTATRQRYGFEKKLLRLGEELALMRTRVNAGERNWRNRDRVWQRYVDLCAGLHVPDDLYKVELYFDKGRLRMSCRKNHYRISRYIDRFGKNILITDNSSWTTDEIVRASLDRYGVEGSFRQSKDDDLVSLMPIRHWTDSKIRCHIFTCVVALTYLRLIELRAGKAGLQMSAATIMDTMHRLHSCLTWNKGKRKPERRLEEATEKQAAILRAFGYKIAGGVLQRTP
jgi:transposase